MACLLLILTYRVRRKYGRSIPGRLVVCQSWIAGEFSVAGDNYVAKHSFIIDTTLVGLYLIRRLTDIPAGMKHAPENIFFHAVAYFNESTLSFSATPAGWDHRLTWEEAKG